MKQKDSAVVYIITHLELGGAQKVCLSLFQGVGSSITTYLIAGNQGELTKATAGIDKVILLKSLQRNIGIKNIFYEIISFFYLIKILRQLKQKHKNIIVHTHSTKAGIMGRWAAFFAGVKKRVHTIHGFAFHDHQPRILWILIYLAELFTSLITTHFICVSTYDAKLGTKLFPKFSDKHTIIRASIDWQQFYIPAKKLVQKDRMGQQFIFGTISCFKKQKNLFDLLQAFKKTHHEFPQCRLEIIGDGVLRKEIENWLAMHRLSDFVLLHGWQEKVAPFMLSWHAFALSSLWEGLPCAIVEARLLKLPVLSYNTGGIGDVITSGSNGFLYPQRDWHSLARGMQELVQNTSLHQQLSHYREDLHDFKDTYMVEQHKELYRTI